mmetsp:Transcript_11529/g.44836  ORF Transcript_11529/g.44836 Transcript_11529/m.44836 type:complete len:273 (+) Transcript_11529:1697-2515(+)
MLVRPQQQQQALVAPPRLHLERVPAGLEAQRLAGRVLGSLRALAGVRGVSQAFGHRRRRLGHLGGVGQLPSLKGRERRSLPSELVDPRLQLLNLLVPPLQRGLEAPSPGVGVGDLLLEHAHGSQALLRRESHLVGGLARSKLLLHRGSDHLPRALLGSHVRVLLVLVVLPKRVQSAGFLISGRAPRHPRLRRSSRGPEHRLRPGFGLWRLLRAPGRGALLGGHGQVPEPREYPLDGLIVRTGGEVVFEQQILGGLCADLALWGRLTRHPPGC